MKTWEITYTLPGENRRLTHYVEADSQIYAAKIFDAQFPNLKRLGGPRQKRK